jgi:hypothetical protein
MASTNTTIQATNATCVCQDGLADGLYIGTIVYPNASATVASTNAAHSVLPVFTRLRKRFESRAAAGRAVR